MITERPKVVALAQEILDQESTPQDWPHTFAASCASGIVATYSGSSPKDLISFPRREDDLIPGDDKAQFLTTSHSIPGPKVEEPQFPVPNMPAQPKTEACRERKGRAPDPGATDVYKTQLSRTNAVVNPGKSLPTTGAQKREQQAPHTESLVWPLYPISQSSVPAMNLSGQGQASMAPYQVYPWEAISEATESSMNIYSSNASSAQTVDLAAVSSVTSSNDGVEYYPRTPVYTFGNVLAQDSKSYLSPSGDQEMYTRFQNWS
jgi:hypothetical protein